MFLGIWNEYNAGELTEEDVASKLFTRLATDLQQKLVLVVGRKATYQQNDRIVIKTITLIADK